MGGENDSKRAKLIANEKSLVGAKLVTTWLFYAIAASLLFVGFRIAFARNEYPNGKTALYFFAASAGVILAREFIYLLPKLVELKVGSFGLKLADEVQTLKEQISEIVRDQIEAQGAGTSAKLEAAKLKGEEE